MRLALSTAETLPRTSGFSCGGGSDAAAGGPGCGAEVVLDFSFNSSSNEGSLPGGSESGKTTGVGVGEAGDVAAEGWGVCAGSCTAAVDGGAGCCVDWVGGFGGGASPAGIGAGTDGAGADTCGGGSTVFGGSTAAVTVGTAVAIEVCLGGCDVGFWVSVAAS
jgi:hypothetical protein